MTWEGLDNNHGVAKSGNSVIENYKKDVRLDIIDLPDTDPFPLVFIFRLVK